MYFLDETWVNEGHTVSKVWVDSNIKTKKQAFLSGLTTGLKNPSGKGRRLILLHIGSDDDFLERGELIMESKKTVDYHEEMTGDIFINWLKKILPLLLPNSVIIMDNAPYHSVKLDCVPMKQWLKNDIIEWMDAKGIEHRNDMVKDELIHQIKAANIDRKYDKFVVDSLAEQAGHKVLRFLSYHCVLNPIESVWSQVKGHIARNNKTFKLCEVRGLLHDGIKLVTSDMWWSFIHSVEKEEQKFWKSDDLCDRVIINSS